MQITITMSRKDALEMGLLVCECGHPPNNHFGKNSCAHCSCKKYREKARRGKLVSHETQET